MKIFELLEDAPIGIVLTDRQLSIQKANPSAQLLLKLLPDEYEGIHLSDFFKGEQHERFSSMFTDPEATPQKSGFIHEGDLYRKVRLSVSLLSAHELLWYIEDQQESFLLEQQIDRFRRLPREYGHDMNNLLTVIISAAQMLKYDIEEGSTLLEDIGDIMDAANRAAAQTHQFMNLGRRLVIDPETLSIQNIIQENAELLHTILGTERLQLHEIQGIAPTYAPKISVLSSMIYLLLHMRSVSAEQDLSLRVETTVLSEDFANSTLGVPFQEAIAVTLVNHNYPFDPENLHSTANMISSEADYLTLCWEGMRRSNGALFSRFANNGHCISLYFPDMSSAL